MWIIYCASLNWFLLSSPAPPPPSSSVIQQVGGSSGILVGMKTEYVILLLHSQGHNNEHTHHTVNRISGRTLAHSLGRWVYEETISQVNILLLHGHNYLS